MYRHKPSRLRGPFSRNRIFWKVPARKAPPSGAPLLGLDAEPEIRCDLVSRVRRDIADGRYDTPEKWDAALDRLCARLNQS